MPGLLIHGARQVLTLRGANSPRRGAALQNLAIIEDGSILIEDGKIREVGATRRIENLAAARNVPQISARGRVVMPGFVDSHLQLIGGLEPAAASRLIRQTPAWRLTEDAGATLKRCLRYGTTTVEVKSCAGLDEVATMKVLNVVAALSRSQPVELISDYCGATLMPAGGEGQAQSHVQFLTSRLLPVIRQKSLAQFVAVNESLFSQDLRQLVRATAGRLGLGVKLHAQGPVSQSSEIDATTVEFLEQVSETDILRLSQSPAIAVLMPGFGFHCEARSFAPARDLIAHGVAVAIASGYDRTLNPSFSMPITIELACRKLAMSPAEAIVAATLNGAYAVGRGASAGSLEPGKNADVLILSTSDYRDLAYETGVNPVETALVRGEVVCQNSVSYGIFA